jgi:hypothetical protein
MIISGLHILTNGFLFYHASIGRYGQYKQDFGTTPNPIPSIIELCGTSHETRNCRIYTPSVLGVAYL